MRLVLDAFGNRWCRATQTSQNRRGQRSAHPARTGGNVEIRRFWRCNRYTPPVICNATLRDGNWKLIRPAIHEAMRTPGIHWLPVSMYKPECFITDAIIHNPKSPRVVPPPPRPELSSNAMDPLE